MTINSCTCKERGVHTYITRMSMLSEILRQRMPQENVPHRTHVRTKTICVHALSATCTTKTRTHTHTHTRHSHAHTQATKFRQLIIRRVFVATFRIKKYTTHIIRVHLHTHTHTHTHNMHPPIHPTIHGHLSAHTHTAGSK